MAVGRQLLKAQGRKQASWLETAAAGITHVQPLPSRSWTSQRPWPSAEVSHQQLQGRGKAGKLRGLRSSPLRGPAVSHKAQQQHTRGVDCLRPSTVSQDGPCIPQLLPKETAAIPPKEQPSLPKTHWEQSCQSSEKARQGGQHFQQTHKGEQSTPREYLTRKTKIRCYTRYQSGRFSQNTALQNLNLR